MGHINMSIPIMKEYKFVVLQQSADRKLIGVFSPDDPKLQNLVWKKGTDFFLEDSFCTLEEVLEYLDKETWRYSWVYDKVQYEKDEDLYKKLKEQAEKINRKYSDQ